MHSLRKLRSTLWVLSQLFLARTFGKYRHSVYADGVSYARYHWRGHDWAFPTEPMDA